MKGSPRLGLVALALLILGAGFAISGCGNGAVASAPDATIPTGRQTTLSEGDAIAQAVAQITALFGVPEDAVTRSTGPTTASPSDAWLKWDGGEASVNTQTGRIGMILPHTEVSYPALDPGASDLDKTVSHVLELLGWDAQTLAAEGFSVGDAKTADHGAGPEYTKTWVGHDEQGLSNQSLIEVALDEKTGKLLRFFYHPGPRATAANAATISKDDAIQIALDTVGSDPPVDPTTTDALLGGPTTTGPAPQIVVTSAELVHSDAPGITGGKDLLIWIVKLGGDTKDGRLHAAVYIDAQTGKVLSESY